MKYTVRFAHLRDKPDWKVGDTVERGDVIGIMGNSGLSTAIHLHIDCVEGEQKMPYDLKAINTGKPKANKTQLDYFIDSELFGVKPFITTKYLDPQYKIDWNKDHPAYDVVPIDRKKDTAHYAIHWNRSMNGKVVLITDKTTGYGNCVYVSFEAKGKA